MFYTSIVLFFGFSVFMISSFGGTVALGGLVSATLLFAMLANLLLLPSLLLSLERNIARKEILKEPTLKILTEDDDDIMDDACRRKQLPQEVLASARSSSCLDQTVGSPRRST